MRGDGAGADLGFPLNLQVTLMRHKATGQLAAGIDIDESPGVSDALNGAQIVLDSFLYFYYYRNVETERTRNDGTKTFR